MVKRLLALLAVMVLVFSVSPVTALTSGDYTYEIENGQVTITGYTGKSQNLTIPTMIEKHRVRKIGRGAFSGNETIRNVKIPSGVTEIGHEAFEDCINLTSVTIPKTVKMVGQGAFWNCINLSNVDIANGVNRIHIDAFGSCNSLKTISIPASAILDAGVFWGSENLEEIIVDPENKNMASIKGVLFNKKEKTLLCYPQARKDTA